MRSPLLHPALCRWGIPAPADSASPERTRGRTASLALQRTLAALALLLAPAAPALAVDQLLFCNQPERLKNGGAYADSRLEAGRSYRIFFHYRNGAATAGPFVVAFYGATEAPLQLQVKKGIADPDRDPTVAGQQAMARFMQAPSRDYRGKAGVRFPLKLKPLQVASGVLTVRAVGQDARLRIYFRHNRWTVPGARVVAVDAPRREYTVTLRPDAKQQYFRIGKPEPGMSQHLDGTYGLVYSFKVDAPPGSKVRVAFSPRGGHSGLVGTVGGILRQSPIVGAAVWSLFTEAVVGKNGLVVTTLPFGGAYYPVELAFHLM
jgi:hypothetical protein